MQGNGEVFVVFGSRHLYTQLSTRLAAADTKRATILLIVELLHKKVQECLKNLTS